MARPFPFVALPFVGLALAGCSSLDGTSLADAATSPAPASLGVAVPPERALATLPAEAGAIVSVVERRSSDGEVKQTVTLAGDPGARGVDRIEVTVREKAFAAAAARRIDAETIEAEMGEAFPGVAMTVSPRVVTTPTGPVGLATGSAGNGVSCLYAWSNGTLRRPTPAADGGLFSTTTPAAAEVRVRLCRKGLSEERLVAVAEGLRITGDLGPVGAALPRTVGVDALSSAGYGVSAATATPATPPSTTASLQPRRPVAKKSPPARDPDRPVVAETKTAPKTDAPISVAAPIPLPSGG